jgi:hypothetical protein
MSDDPRLVAVKATKRDFYILKHPTYGTPLDDYGEGVWVNDGNVTRLIQEGALRIIERSAMHSLKPPPDPVEGVPAHVEAKTSTTSSKKG